MHSLEEARGWIEARMEDVYGADVGTVVAVYFDPEDERVHWFQVRLSGGDPRLTLVPVHYSIASPAHVWVPIARDQIASAPAVAAGRVVTREEELDLCSHYGGLRRRIVVLNDRPHGSETVLPAGTGVRFRPREG